MPKPWWRIYPLSAVGQNLAAVAHDTRDMVTALDLYCDLLQEPGVLGEPFTHYGSELSRRRGEPPISPDKLRGLILRRLRTRTVIADSTRKTPN